MKMLVINTPVICFGGNDMENGKKFLELTNLIDYKDRCSGGVYEAWDLINSLVNEVYGIDIGEALDLWEQHNG